MALLFVDSFDHYVTADVTEKWTTSAGSVTISAGNGRRGSASFRFVHSSNNVQTGISKTLNPSGSTAILGVAFKTSVAPPLISQLLTVQTGTTPQVTLRLNPDMTLSAVRGNFQSGTVLGTTSATLTVAVEAYLELKVLLHVSAGTVDVRVNGVSVLALTGQNTANSGTTWNAIALGQYDVGSAVGNLHTLDFDDLYVLDGSGSAPWQDFLGDCRVDVRLPSAGALAQFTPSAGSNYQNIDDTAPDDDSTYNATSTTGYTDTFVVEDAPVAGAALYGVQVSLSAKKTDAGTCSLASVVRESSSNQVAAAQNPSTSYAYLRTVYQVDPHTSAQWTEANFNAAEFGYQRTA